MAQSQGLYGLGYRFPVTDLRQMMWTSPQAWVIILVLMSLMVLACSGLPPIFRMNKGELVALEATKTAQTVPQVLPTSPK